MAIANGLSSKDAAVRCGVSQAVGSVGSQGDSYDNALAESFNGLYKTELIRKDGPWRGLEDVEYATLEYLDWFNRRRLHTELGMVPPAEFEAAHYHEEAPA
jgi:putative transposase